RHPLARDRISQGLQNDRHGEHVAQDAHAGRGDRQEGGLTLRLCGELARPRRRPREYALPELPRASDRTLRLPHHRLSSDGERLLSLLRREHSRPLGCEIPRPDYGPALCTTQAGAPQPDLHFALDEMKSLHPPRPGRLLWAVWLLSVLSASSVCAWHLKAADLRVYYAAASSYFCHSGPMYGPNDVFGWPMLYRYPPLFLCLFRPFALLPLRAAVGLWAGLKVFLLGPLLRMWRRRFIDPARVLPAVSVSALVLMPYFVHELEKGNVQLLLVELVCFALLLCDEHPFISSLLLGLTAAIKVWPALLFPYLALRGRWRLGVYASLAAALLTVPPACSLGWKNLLPPLAQWYAQEKRINALLGDKWYPSQSLRGVMLRYLTWMDYSGLPDPN